MTGLERLAAGKVRDMYAAPDGLLLVVASDRISAYDQVLPTPIPDKGRVLTALSVWWFERLSDLVPHHLVSVDDPAIPAEWRGRAMLVRRLEMLPVECVARGYLTGSGLAAYRDGGAICSVPLPPGLTDGSRLPEPIFTPTTKAPVGAHDEAMTYPEVEAAIGPERAAQLRELTLAVYRRAAGIAAERGVLLADTKLEFGLDAEGVLTLGDEVLTPDSSRWWPADRWQPGRPQPSYDKQFVRDWLSAHWDRQGEPPPLPAEIVAQTRARYVEAYERITGSSFADWPGA
ncbi:MAG TPA: phosphoribosylaminoimidazolesuccinocarboxamide synthase [Mycobacteriales bacterium]|nr:phosphoribosylaminoimidazolesuccinocarboxamide synthase [Mycobacteriales bacterium]